MFGWLLRRRRSTTDPLVLHLYALCWNDERMLPWFFRHYDRYIHRYFIFDNGSTDRSRELLAAHPRVVWEPIVFDGDSFVDAARAFYDRCWHGSRGHADYVILCNIDEHHHHPDLLDHLTDARARGITVVPSIGYHMVSDCFPEGSGLLCEIIRRGTRHPSMDKPQIFDPAAIREIRFEPGRHRADPQGRVLFHPEPEIKLLHYKQLGDEYVFQRQAELGARMRAGDIAKGWGRHYRWSTEERLAFLREKSAEAREILPPPAGVEK